MNKLEMAHQMACAMMASNDGYTIGGAIECAWEYADAMQKEWDEREKVEAEQKRKEIREMLNAPNTFVEREGQHFDDVEWQPDWSQAPEWANYLVMTLAGTSYWFESTPWTSGNGWIANGISQLAFCNMYHKGDWKESLRKRP